MHIFQYVPAYALVPHNMHHVDNFFHYLYCDDLGQIHLAAPSSTASEGQRGDKQACVSRPAMDVHVFNEL